MSIAAIQWAWRQSCTPGAKLLLLALADHCNSNYNGCECWPSLDRLVGLTGLSRSSVCKYTNELENLGHIRRDRSNGRTATVYRLTMQQSATRTVEDAQQSATRTVEDAQQSATRTVEETQLSATRTPTVRHTDSNSPPHGLEPVIEPERTGKAERERAIAHVRATRLSLSDLPADWHTWALQERPDLDPQRTWERFRDYWISQPNPKGMKADWPATWRNWIRRESSPTQEPLNGKSHARLSETQRHAAINAKLIADARAAAAQHMD